MFNVRCVGVFIVCLLKKLHSPSSKNLKDKYTFLGHHLVLQSTKILPKLELYIFKYQYLFLNRISGP